MEKVFSPECLRLARQRRGLFVQELAAKIGMSVKSVSLWENGKKAPKDDSIAALSTALDFPPEFFFGEAPPVLEKAVFRSLARTTARERDMALSAGSLAIGLDRLIEERFRRPQPRLPDLRDSTPEVAAESLRADWGLGYKPIRNLVHILESNGIRIYSLAYDNPAVDAFSVWQGNIPFIFLNTKKTAERGRLDAAHEVGHLVLHGHDESGIRQSEKEAQRFASAFLMPKATFVASAPRAPTLACIIEAKQKWGVSAMAYVYRLHTLRLISDWHYQQLCIHIRSTFGVEEPGPAVPRESSQVLAKVIGSNGISRKEIGRHLSIPMRDLDEITFGLTLTPISGGGRTQSKASGGAPVRLVQ